MFNKNPNLNRKFILLTTSIASFITPFTSTVITFAVPGIGNEFHANFYLVTWIPISFLVSLTSLMITIGRLSDIFGRALFFRIGFVIFVISSLLIYLSNNIYELIIFTFIAGIGAAFVGTNSTAIVSHVYPDKKRGGALGINAMSVYLGLTLAPFLGGMIIQLYGWRTIFILIIILSILAFFLSFITLKGMNSGKKLKLDKIGIITFSSSLFFITTYFSMSEFIDFYFSIMLILSGLILFFIFIWHEFRIDYPLIDFKIFKKSRTFTFSNISAFLNYLSTFSIVFIFSLYLQVLKGISPFQAGLILSVEPILMVAISPISGRLSDRYGSREIAAIGTSVIGIGFIMLYIFNLSNTLNIIMSLSIIGIGFGLFTAPNTNSVMGSVEKKDLSLASGILGTVRFTGQIFSIVISSIIISRAVPRKELILMFAGYMGSFGYINPLDFTSAVKSVVLISSILSFLASFTSLMKNRGE